MKKASKTQSKSKSAAPAIDPYLEGLMGKLLDRLVSLESKMEVVIAQTASRPQGSAPSQAPRAVQNHAPKEFPRRERPMFEAICADCKVPCEVPFRPSEGRSVYCKECFAQRKAAGNRQAVPPPAPKPASPAPAPADKKQAAPVKKKKKK